jgi:hypothetical protein
MAMIITRIVRILYSERSVDTRFRGLKDYVVAKSAKRKSPDFPFPDWYNPLFGYFPILYRRKGDARI